MIAEPMVTLDLCRDYAWLADYAAGWQFGEQGMLQELARRCGCRSGFEIGAGNGTDLPVTLSFMDELILFEKDEQKQRELAVHFPDSYIYGAYEDEHATLIDDGSIVVVDVDSIDLNIAISVLQEAKPAIMCIEHYDRLGPYMADEKGQEPNEPVPGWLLGLTVHKTHTIQQPWQVIAPIMDSHGYRLVALTRVNGIYVDKELERVINGWTDSEDQ